MEVTPLDVWSQVSIPLKPASAAPPGPVRVRTIVDALDTVVLELSSIVTVGWLASAVPGSPAPGCVVNTSWAGELDWDLLAVALSTDGN
jgi:hypothetical protein